LELAAFRPPAEFKPAPELLRILHVWVIAPTATAVMRDSFLATAGSARYRSSDETIHSSAAFPGVKMLG